MDCRDFDGWLDEGRPAAERSAAEGHAAGCARCEAELAAALALEGALAQRFATTDASFTDRVLERIAAERPAPSIEVPFPEPSLPWWVRALQEPATLFACSLAAALVAGAPRLLGIARTWTLEVASLPGAATAWLETGPSSLAVPIVVLAVLAVTSVAVGAAALRWIDG